MKKVQEVKEIIGSKLKTTLSIEGFVFKKSGFEFVKKQEDFSFIFNLLLTSWSDYYSLIVRLYITSNEIEKLYEKILGKSHRLTMGNELDLICNSWPNGKEVLHGMDKQLFIYNDNDILIAANTLLDYYNLFAKKYFDRYNSLKEIDEIFNNEPFHHNPAHVNGNLDDRCIKGLIVAKLTNNSNYETIISKYDELIQKTKSPISISNYIKVKETLKTFNE